MELHYINPFIESVFETLSTVVQGKIERGDIALPRQARDSHTVVALIGVNGPAQHSANTPKKGESSA